MTNNSTIPAIGDVLAFPIPQLKGWGLAQVIYSFEYDTKEKVLNVPDGTPMLTLAYTRHVTPNLPALKDFAQATLLIRDAFLWKSEKQIINVVAEDIPSDYVRLGTEKTIVQLDERSRNWGDWNSTLEVLIQQHQWEALPPELTQRFKEALKSDDRITLPGSLNQEGQPREYRLSDTTFHDDWPGTIKADFQLTSLQALPTLYKLILHRWYNDLPQYLNINPIAKDLKLHTHHQTRLDFTRSNLESLTIDVSGLQQLHIPASLRTLALIGTPDIDGLQVVSTDQGAQLTLRMTQGIDRITGLGHLQQLNIMRPERCDIATIAQRFSHLQGLELFGKPSFLDNANDLKALKKLRWLWLFETFGFDSIPGPAELPQLRCIRVSSIPAEAAAAIKKHYKSVPDMALNVERPRKPEWLAENLDNPLRAWDGRDGIPASKAKKAFSLYKTTLVAMRKAVAAGENLQTEAERITQECVAAFNALDKPRRFIETIEREEIVDALQKIWNLLPESIDQRILEQIAEDVGD